MSTKRKFNKYTQMPYGNGLICPLSSVRIILPSFLCEKVHEQHCLKSETQNKTQYCSYIHTYLQKHNNRHLCHINKWEEKFKSESVFNHQTLSTPMSNRNQGVFEPEYPPNNAPPPNQSQGDSYETGAQGFVPGQPQNGHAPIPKKRTYGEAPPNYDGQQPPIGGMPQPQAQYNGDGGGFQPVSGCIPQDPISTQPGKPSTTANPVHRPGQPTGPASDWMSIPIGIPNCPRGLEYLSTVDQLLVEQKVQLFEAFTGFQTNNKFSIKNALGQKVYYAVEDNNCCTRNICKSSRPFDVKVFDNFRNEVIHIYRPLACSRCCFPCCLQTIEISSPPGNRVGSVEQEWSICAPSFRIKNHIGDTVLRIDGPVCKCCSGVKFKVVSLSGETVGKITKKWSGWAREIFTDADFFGITFPMDLDVRMKAVLLGATFLIDAMYFEK